jgi:uncharacterized membrane protein
MSCIGSHWPVLLDKKAPYKKAQTFLNRKTDEKIGKKLHFNCGLRYIYFK